MVMVKLRSSLKTADDAAVDVSIMPLLIIEEMDSDYQGVEEARKNLNYLGGLHPIHWPWIKRVHLVHPCSRQLYVVVNLDYCLHYSIAAKDLDQFRHHCSCILNNNSNFIEYGAGKSHTSDPFLKVWNDGTPEFCKVAPYFLEMDLEGSFSPLFDGPAGAKLLNSRNNLQISSGFAAMNQQRDPLTGQHEAIPQLCKNINQFRRHLVKMTDLACKLKLDFVPILMNKANRAHLATFAQKIDERNAFPACTVGSTKNPKQLLLSHVDSKNAKEKGHNVQMVASTTFKGHDNKTQRIFLSVHGREVCASYLKRKKQSDEATGLLKKVFDAVPEYQHEITPAITEGGDTTIRGGMHILPAMLDKHSTISFFVDCIFRLEEACKLKLCLFRIIELCLVVGWLSAHDQFYTILIDKWATQGCIPAGNLALAYLKEMHIRGGCNAGDCTRYQPSFITNITEGQVVRSLVCLHTIVRQINSSKFPTDNSMYASYKQAVQVCKQNVVGVDGLTSQNVIHTLILTGAIQVKSKFATIAVVGGDTPLFRILLEKFPGITQLRSEKLLKVVAGNMKKSTRVVQEMLWYLEKGKDITQLVEPVIKDQTYRFALNHGYKELRHGSSKFVTYLPPKRKATSTPMFGAGVYKWWAIILSDLKKKSGLKMLLTSTLHLDNNIIPVVSPCSKSFISRSNRKRKGGEESVTGKTKRKCVHLEGDHPEGNAVEGHDGCVMGKTKKKNLCVESGHVEGKVQGDLVENKVVEGLYASTIESEQCLLACGFRCTIWSPTGLTPEMLALAMKRDLKCGGGG